MHKTALFDVFIQSDALSDKRRSCQNRLNQSVALKPPFPPLEGTSARGLGTSLPSRTFATEETVAAFEQSDDGSGVLKLRISWGDYYTADAVYLIEASTEGHQVAASSPRLVTLPTSASANWADFSSDSPLILRKGDICEFEFETGTTVGTGTRRDYVIVARGNYRPDDAVFPSASPKEFAPFANYQNPFNASTTIGFSLGQQQHVRPEIFNVLGQSVAVLADREFPGGEHNLTWNATDGNRRPVASGTYMYRISTGRHADIRKMTVLK